MSVDETADNITHMESTKLPKSENSAAAIAKPHPDFWYPGGSVILEVGNTKFKLYQSILQRQSAYFSSSFQKEAAYLEVEKGIPNLTIPVYQTSARRRQTTLRLCWPGPKNSCVYLRFI